MTFIEMMKESCISDRFIDRLGHARVEARYNQDRPEADLEVQAIVHKINKLYVEAVKQYTCGG